MTSWPYDSDLMPAGALGEWELDAACWRKRQIALTAEQCHAVDETAGLCGVCGGECPVPQACQQAERTHRRQRAVIVVLAVVLGAVIAAVCWVNYLRVPS